MRSLFLPAIGLMNCLRYPAKFLVLGATVSAVVVVLLFTVFVHLSHDIKIADAELAGLQILKPVNRLVQYTQQHRGLSSGVLNGNEAMRPVRAAKQQETGHILAEAEAILPQVLRDSARWKEIRTTWASIEAEGLGLSVEENLKRHTSMINELLIFMVDVSDETQLTLDPEIDSYYAMDTVVNKMPAMLEPMGIMRARGTGVLTSHELTSDTRRNIAALLERMNGTLRLQNSNIEKVIRHAPEQRPVLEPRSREFTQGVKEVLALVQRDILSEQFSTKPADYFAMVTKVIDSGYLLMFDTLIPQFEQQLQQRREQASRMLMLESVLSVIVILLLLYLGVGTYYSVIGSVETFSNGASRLADGDMTARFDTHGVDELHQAGLAFNDMASTIRGLFARIQSDAGELRNVANMLADSSHQISSSASAQSDSAGSMAASVEQMTVGVDHIARNAQDAESYSRESDRIAAEGGAIVRQVVEEIQGIAETVNVSAEALEALGRQSDQISTIVGTIKDIADQTNLLALNAAIEAARAGETGRGFAVVADEVRKLAERTASSTQEIAGMIAGIQQGTTKAVGSMKGGVERVAVGVDQAQRAGQAISRVQEQARRVLDAVSEITIALREQATASTEIAQNVEHIAQKAEENNALAVNNAGAADELRVLAETLSKEMSRFRT